MGEDSNEEEINKINKRIPYNHIPYHALRLMELLAKCKCDLCQKELERLEEKYGVK